VFLEVAVALDVALPTVVINVVVPPADVPVALEVAVALLVLK